VPGRVPTYAIQHDMPYMRRSIKDCSIGNFDWRCRANKLSMAVDWNPPLEIIAFVNPIPTKTGHAVSMTVSSPPAMRPGGMSITSLLTGRLPGNLARRLGNAESRSVFADRRSKIRASDCGILDGSVHSLKLIVGLTSGTADPAASGVLDAEVKDDVPTTCKTTANRCHQPHIHIGCPRISGPSYSRKLKADVLA